MQINYFPFHLLPFLHIFNGDIILVFYLASLPLVFSAFLMCPPSIYNSVITSHECVQSRIVFRRLSSSILRACFSYSLSTCATSVFTKRRFKTLIRLIVSESPCRAELSFNLTSFTYHLIFFLVCINARRVVKDKEIIQFGTCKQSFVAVVLIHTNVVVVYIF